MKDTARLIVLVCVALSLPLVSEGDAPSAELIKDIQPGPASSSPSWVVEIDRTLFFTADDGVAGNELWKSDGTPDGTVLVKDIVPGPDGSLSMSLTKVGDTLFFTVRNDATGRELWKSDGTEAGTVMVKDIIPGTISSSPSDLIDYNGVLFFVARVPTGATNRELMKSDGTAEGTVLVNDSGYPYPPHFPGTGFSAYMTIVNNTLFFKAEPISPYTHPGLELWKTDGTALGTVMVKDVNPGPGDSTPSSLTDVNGTLFFQADDGSTGFELWKSDGTEAGTVLVKDIDPGITGSFGYDPDSNEMLEFNNKLYFQTDDGVHGMELWMSDGTTGGTEMVKDIKPGPESSNSFRLVPVGTSLFLGADDGVNGHQLWRSDGTTASTVMVRIMPSAFPIPLKAFDGFLFFNDSTPSTGSELWLSDGTDGGTVMVEDMNPGPGSGGAAYLTNLRGTLVFRGFDGGTTGGELWRVDCPQEFGVCGDPFTVNSVADLVDQTPDGFCDTGNMVGPEHECTLRAAIQESNANDGAQRVDFDIPQDQATNGVFIIATAPSLPIITKPVIIDASTQQGFQPGAPVVELKGPGGVNALKGFRITAGDSVIRGFSIYGFGYNGILLKTKGDNLIESNIIGTNAQNIPDMGNGEAGILIRNSSDNTIGGSAVSSQNVISGNGQSGTGGCGITMITSAENRVIGNRIGTDLAGMVSLGNNRSGVCLEDAGSNYIGGSGVNDGNIISGNGYHGIHITGEQSSMNSVLGNIIGLDQAGDGTVPNVRNGVLIDQAGVGNLIGDGTPWGSNTISGNAEDGVVVIAGAGSNHIDWNLIGSDATGQAPRPNQNGVFIKDSPDNKIGVYGGNTISGNTGHGLLVSGDSAESTWIQGNHIGIDFNGLLPLGNWLDGVRLAGVRFTKVVGNAIADNGGCGVAILGADEDGYVHHNQINAANLVSSNSIGGDHAGGIPGNVADGITINDSSSNDIWNNLILSNGRAGISVIHQTWGDGNYINGNTIAHNIALGIDLGADYVTPNDAMDADTGANGLQNFPEITTIVGYPLNQARGILHSAPNGIFSIQIFSNTEADTSDHGEGEVFEGAFVVTTDASGDGSFSAGFGMGQSGDCISATAREAHSNDTSEFSVCVTIPPPPPPVDLDFGDAPEAGGRYPTLLANNGARHVVDPGIHLGSLIDNDTDGQPNADAMGDDVDGSDDEDGVDFVEPLITLSSSTAVHVSASATGLLDAWIDFNGDGDWSDVSDRIFTNEPLVPGVNTLSFTIPGDAIAGATFARFRFSTEGVLGPIGPAMDGEVEDYSVEIIDHETVIFFDGFESGGSAAWSMTTP